MMTGFRLISVLCGALLLVGCTTRAIQDEGATDDGATAPGLGDDGSPGGDGGGGGGTEPDGGPDDGGDEPPDDDGGDPDDPTSSPGDSGTDEPPPPGEPPEGIMVWLVGIGGCDEGASAFEGLPKLTLDWDELICEEPVDCTNNRAPEFGEPLYLINGMLMDLDWARVGDTVGILIPFADADCNLDCGQQFAMEECPGGMGGGGGGQTGIGVPCNTESSGVWIGFDLMTLTAPGEYIVSLGVDDRCMASESFELTFSL